MYYNQRIAIVILSLAGSSAGSSIIRLYHCTDGDRNFNVFCAPIVAGSESSVSGLSESFAMVPVDTQSDGTIIKVDKMNSTIAVPDVFVLLQPEEGSESEDLVTLRTSLRVSSLSKPAPALGLGYMSPLVVGETSVLSNFAITKTNLVLNSQNQARNFCQDGGDSIKLVPVHPPNTLVWSVRVGANVFKIDSASDLDVVPRPYYDRIVEYINNTPNVTVIGESNPYGGQRALITNCEDHMHLFPNIRYPIKDDTDQIVATINLHPQDYLNVVKTKYSTPGQPKACKLQIAPTTNIRAYTLGVNIFKKMTVYFERSSNQIGFCESR